MMKTFVFIFATLLVVINGATIQEAEQRHLVSDCCKTLLHNIDYKNGMDFPLINTFEDPKDFEDLIAKRSKTHRNTIFKNTMFGVRNAQPKWENPWVSNDSIYYNENGKWVITGDLDEVCYIAEASADCPELVENWLNVPDTQIQFNSIQDTWKIAGGKLRCG